MSELIYASVRDTYQYVYNNNGDNTIQMIRKFPEDDAFVFKMEYDELQICRIGKHRYFGRPSSYYQYYYEKVGRDFFRDSFSSIFELQFVDEKHFNALAYGSEIVEFREQGDIDSLRTIGSSVNFSEIISRDVLEEILHAVILMLNFSGAGCVEIGIPFAKFDANMNYDSYVNYCKEFGRLWREILSNIYAYLPYLLRRLVGFTVNASNSYSNKKICVVPIEKKGDSVVCLLNPPKERDPECMKLVNYLVQAKDNEDLTRRLDALKESVEDYCSDGGIDRIQSSAYIRVLDEIAKFESMDEYHLIEELHDESVKATYNKADEAYLARLTQYISDHLTVYDVDQFIKITLSRNFEQVVPYINFLLDVIHKPFPDYHIPYSIILSAIDEYATANVFTKDDTAARIENKYNNLLDLIDKEASRKDCLSIYQCAHRLLKSRFDDYLKEKREEMRSKALKEIEENDIQWGELEKWLRSWNGENTLTEIKTLKSRKIIDALPSMQIDCTEASEILEHCKGCLDEETYEMLTNLFHYILMKPKGLITDLLSIEGKTESLGLNLNGPVDYLVHIFSSRYKNSNIYSWFNQRYNGAKIEDLLNLEITFDYNIKNIYRRTLISVLQDSQLLELQIPRGDLARYYLFIQNLCTAGIYLSDIPAKIQMEVGSRYEMLGFEHLDEAKDVFGFALEKRNMVIEPETIGYLLDDRNRYLLNYMFENNLLHNYHFEAMIKKSSVRQNENMCYVFTILTGNQYGEELKLSSLKEIVQRETITSQDIGKWFSSKSHFKPIESLVELVREQDNIAKKQNKKKLLGDNAKIGDNTYCKQQNNTVEKQNKKKLFGDNAKISNNTAREQQNNSLTKNNNQVRHPMDYTESVIYGICAILLIFSIVGFVFVFIKKESSVLFYIITTISSLFAGLSVALFLDKYIDKDSKFRKIPFSFNWISIGFGVVLSIILITVSIMLGTGLFKAKKTSELSMSSKTSTSVEDISQNARPLKNGEYSISTINGEYLCPAIDNESVSYLKLTETPYVFYIEQVSDNSYVIFTDKNNNTAIMLYGTGKTGHNFSVEEYDESSESMRFYLKWLKDDLYQISCVYNNEVWTVNNLDGEVKITSPKDGQLGGGGVFWRIKSQNRKDLSKKNYQPQNGHVYNGKCLVSTMIDGIKYYLACGDDSYAYLTQNDKEAILYRESDSNGNLYFVSVDESGKKLSLCFKGTKPKDSALLRFSVNRNDTTYQWIDNGTGLIRYANDTRFGIFADNDTKVILKNIDENSNGSWMILNLGK